jgi:hypothetical protein
MVRKRKPSGRKKRQGRSQDSLRRYPGSRMPRARILIVCEGEETEPNYFRAFRRHLRLTSVEVEVEGKHCGSAPISVVEFAIRRKDQRAIEARQSDYLAEYDEVWCVIDVENPSHNTSFDKAIRRASSSGLRLAVSNPAFEFWYLLHYEDTSRAFASGNEVKRALALHVPDYTESKDMFAELYELTDTAIERSERVLEKHPNGEPFPNPSTLVFKLVRRLVNLANC